jgi:predicted MFS family arabinose efflux permease
MWTTDSLWFEIAIVSIIFAIGNMVMGHFEERTPKARRVGKFLLTLLIVCSISVFFGRTISMILLGFFFLPILYIHLYYLPRKKGINGWTGEPKSTYYDFRGWDKNIFHRKN